MQSQFLTSAGRYVMAMIVFFPLSPPILSTIAASVLGPKFAVPLGVSIPRRLRSELIRSIQQPRLFASKNKISCPTVTFVRLAAYC